MRERSADEIQLREYLLGNIPEENCEEIEAKLLTDAEFEKLADLIEEDIIEDYLDGSLSSREKEAVESRFLRPPERKRKLWFIRLLRSHASPESREPRRWFPFLLSNWQMKAGIAAMVLLSLSLGIYNIALRRDLQSQQDSLERAQKQNEELQQKLSALHKSNTYVELSLVSGAVRGKGDIPEVRFDADRTGLQIHVLPIGKASSYQASIDQSDGTQIWSGNDLKIAESGLEVVIPVARTLPPGHYFLIVSPSYDPSAKQRYPFTIVK